MSNRLLLLIVAWSLLGWSVQSARAQQFSTQTDAGQIERSRLPNPTLPLAPGALSSGEPPESDNNETALVPATSGDSDLGVQSLLRAPVRPTPWSVFADGGFVFTTNVALTPNHTQSDEFFVGEGGVGYDLKLTPDLNLSAAVRQQYFAYSRFGELDFGSLNFGLGLSYTAHPARRRDSQCAVRLHPADPARVFDNEFFRDGSLDLSAQKLFTFGRAQLVSAGGDIGLNVSVPHVAEREEFGLSAGYVLQITRHPLAANRRARGLLSLRLVGPRGFQPLGQRGADVFLHVVVQRGRVGFWHGGPFQPRGVRLRRAQHRGQRVLPAQILTPLPS